MKRGPMQVWTEIESALQEVGDADIRAGLAWINDAGKLKIVQAAMAACQSQGGQMTAWSSDFESAPKDRPQILMRHPDWSCPVIAEWSDVDDSWICSEPTIQELVGGMIDPDGVEWALIPE